MKILLIQPPSFEKYTVGPPLGLGYLASCAEKEGHNIKISESIILGKNLRKLKKDIKNFDPDIVGTTSTTLHINKALNLVKFAKKNNPNCKTILGGPHATSVGKETLRNSDFLDIIVRGEGEETFTELLRHINKNDLSKINGISYKKNGKIYENENRGFIQDLDSIPFPAYHLLSMDKYKIKYVDSGLLGKKNQAFGTILTSRGCPYKCIFCSTCRIWGRKWRGRSPENVVEELKILSEKYNREVIEIVDDTFTLDKKRALKICQLIKKENIDVSLVCMTRVDHFDEDIANALKMAGCNTVIFGIESGVQKTLDYLNKGFKLEDSERSVKIAKKVGLNTIGYFIIGAIGETKETINQTIEYAKKLDLDYCGFSLFIPYPGTKLYEIAKNQNLLLTKDWSKYDYFNLVMKIPGFSNRELKKIRKKADIELNSKRFLN